MRKKMFIASVVFLLVCFLSFSISAYHKSYYKINDTLSNYLDTQGFKLGISRGEAIEYYEIDYQIAGKMFTYSSKVFDIKTNFPRTEGFYEFSFHNSYGNVTNYLYKIAKCISIQETFIDEGDVVKAFNVKYNVKLPACLIHHGRYIIVDLHSKSSFNSAKNSYALILSVEDETEKVIKQEDQEKEYYPASNKARESF